jgi:DUF438 domain-containing protein
MLENRQAERKMNEMRSVFKSIFGGQGGNDEILYAKLFSLLRELKEYELHYLKKENILFPYIEKAFHEYRCLKIMWSFHDDFRIRLKGRFIHIRYFALRDRKNKYKGTIEVSQDVTDIRSLKGERRLLEWDEKQ